LASLTHVPAEELATEFLDDLPEEPEPPPDPPEPPPDLLEFDGVDGVAVDGVAVLVVPAVVADGVIICDGAALAANTVPAVKPIPNVSVVNIRFIYPSHYFISLMNI
jgi:hypothetical protein